MFLNRYSTGVSRGSRARVTTTGYGRSTTKCSSDASAGGNILSYANALLRTDSESVETMVRRRRILFAGLLARMGEERLPRRVMFGEILGGKGYSGGQEWDWMNDLEDLKTFVIEFEGWREAAQKVGRWF